MHLVIEKFRLEPKQVAIQLKGDATERLIAEGIHPFGHLKQKNRCPPKCFARGEWKVFLDTAEDVRRAIEFVNENPLKEGKQRQSGKFVTIFAEE